MKTLSFYKKTTIHQTKIIIIIRNQFNLDGSLYSCMFHQKLSQKYTDKLIDLAHIYITLKINVNRNIIFSFKMTIYRTKTIIIIRNQRNLDNT